MADLQTQFRTFHDTIKLSNVDENATLREKRDVLLDKLRANLANDFADRDDPTPTFDVRNQGSYAMHVGVKPLNGDYDIDVALLFNVDRSDHGPLEVKTWVFDAMRGHTVEFKRPCVTVQYQRKGEALYHVDLAVYAATSGTWLSFGYPGSSSDNKEWAPSDPVGLCDAVNNRFAAGVERDQFRRVIRYLKRWKDFKFSTSGNAAPVGIAVTLAAYHWFQPRYTDPVAGKQDDLTALRDLVAAMRTRFSTVLHDGETARRLRTPLPVTPKDDPLERMSNKQMTAFEDKLGALQAALDSAIGRADPVQAARDVHAQLGDDFPIPTKRSTGVVGGPAFVSSGQSA